MLPRPPAIVPATASAAPAVIFCTSTNTASDVAAAMSNFPSCVIVMPVGAEASGTTRTSSVFPLDRLSAAIPMFSPRPVRDTKTQQPSFDGATIKGEAGREMVTDGDAAGALQSSDWVCAAVEAAV